MDNLYTPIKVALIDDHNLVRTGFVSLINGFGNFEIVAEASNADELINLLSKQPQLPDVCLLDINMQPINGWEVLLRVRKQWPSVKMLILSFLEAKDIVDNIMYFKVNGYLPKNCYAHDLKEALISVHCKGFFFTDNVQKLMFTHQNDESKARLSKNELKFLSYVAEDCTYKEIAIKMNVSVRTIDGYRDALFEKLDIHTRQGLVIYAIRAGLISPFVKLAS